MRVETRVDQGLHAYPVRLLFIGAAVAQGGTLGGCLGCGQGGHAGVGAGGGQQHEAGEHRRQGQRLVLLLEFHAAGKVSLAQVGDFVAQYGDQLILGLGVQQQAVVDADDAARHGKCVDFRTVDDNYFYPAVFQFAVGNQQVDEMFKVVMQQRVVHGGHLAAENTQPGSSQLIFEFRGKHAGGRLAEIG